MDTLVDGCWNKEMEDWMDECVNRWMDEWVNGWAEWIWMDGWMFAGRKLYLWLGYMAVRRDGVWKMIMQCVCADFDTQCVNKLLWLSVFVCAHLTLSYSNEPVHLLCFSDRLSCESCGYWATLNQFRAALYLSTYWYHEGLTEFPNITILYKINIWRR